MPVCSRSCWPKICAISYAPVAQKCWKTAVCGMQPEDDVWGVERMTGELEPVTLLKNGNKHTLYPIWVVIYQHENGTARWVCLRQ